MSTSTIIRIEKLHTIDQVAGADAHNLRSNPPSHANRSMIQKNVVLLGGGVPTSQLLIARLRTVGIHVPLKKKGLIRRTKQPRRQRIIAFNVLCGAGEKFFRKIDPVRWAESCVQYLQQTFGAENVLSAQLHLDERVPHLHAIVVPLTPQNCLSAAQVLGQDRASEPEGLDGVRRGNVSVPFLRRLQREFHQLCRGFDSAIAEPVPGGVMTHQLVSEWREWIAHAHQEIPALPRYIVHPPTPDDRLAPEMYAQRQVDSCQQQVQQTIAALHAKAVQHDEQVASNQHMQKTLRELDHKNRELNERLLEVQQRFRQIQVQQADLSLHELCECLGLPIEQIQQQPHIVLPNGNAIHVPAEATRQPYTIQTWDETPTLLGTPMLFGLTEEQFLTGLATIVPIDRIERLVAYRDRFDLRFSLQQQQGTGMEKLARVTSLDADSLPRLAQALQSNFGIWESWLNPSTEFIRNFETATNVNRHLVLLQTHGEVVRGIAVNGSKPSNATGSPFEQYLGTFCEDPVTVGSGTALHTVIVSNVIEAFSMLSIPELTRSIRVVVSGITRLEKVIARALDRPRPVILVEYASGRRCGRHRRLREMLQQRPNNEVRKLCPSDLRLGKATFETIGLDVQQNPQLGPQIARLIGVPSVGGRFPKFPNASTNPPASPSSHRPPSSDESISW